MARKAKNRTTRDRFDAWMATNPMLANSLVGLSVAGGLIGLVLFVTFSGFGSSAEFIYNQF